MQTSLAARSFTERAGHAVAFELIAVAICAPALAWVMDRPLAHVGALTAMFSAVAMLWNMAFNALFDRAQARIGFERRIGIRMLHAVLFGSPQIVHTSQLHLVSLNSVVIDQIKSFLQFHERLAHVSFV